MGKIGIIGGSGLYKIEGFTDVQEIEVQTPFGSPSDAFMCGMFEGKEVVFLPRHGRGHRINPSEINYRANIFAMKKLGVERIISLTACGSLRAEMKPLDFVLPDQFVDRTNQARKMTFFENGIVAHVSLADPVCADLRRRVYESVKLLGFGVHDGGTYITMEGPAFSTRAESNLYRSWGMDIIGMTNMSEAKLAREAEICYVTVAAVTDFDCWYQSAEEVTLEMVIDNLHKNVDRSKAIVRRMIKELPVERACGCGAALQNAIVTDRSMIPEKLKKDLAPVIGKYIQ
ncbi:MAG TPA: S-methyl-5'-thioadenosine phosphorylase [Candidatus Omnitrophota bacterium]|nr:S-methyl-5'-thioadenosine phosphorylase [Candidatus Omnitrophota bacterium]HQQ06190.1 S-methyl-5'-thioadenosine phosphorylase [Candidatus Omnitrophota bacterium]